MSYLIGFIVLFFENSSKLLCEIVNKFFNFFSKIYFIIKIRLFI